LRISGQDISRPVQQIVRAKNLTIVIRRTRGCVQRALLISFATGTAKIPHRIYTLSAESSFFWAPILISDGIQMLMMAHWFHKKRVFLQFAMEKPARSVGFCSRETESEESKFCYKDPEL
jgi:hypothetical protein